MQLRIIRNGFWETPADPHKNDGQLLINIMDEIGDTSILHLFLKREAQVII